MQEQSVRLLGEGMRVAVFGPYVVPDGIGALVVGEVQDGTVTHSIFRKLVSHNEIDEACARAARALTAGDWGTRRRATAMPTEDDEGAGEEEIVYDEGVSDDERVSSIRSIGEDLAVASEDSNALACG